MRSLVCDIDRVRHRTTMRSLWPIAVERLDYLFVARHKYNCFVNCSFRLCNRWRVTGYHWPVYGCISFGLTLLNIGLKFCLFHWSNRSPKILSAATPATRDSPCKVFRDKSACQLNLLYKTLRRSVNWDIFEFSGVSLPIISCIFTRQISHQICHFRESF